MFFTEATCLFIGFILHISGIHGEAEGMCALKGSSVGLPCKAQHPISNKTWYTLHWDGSKYMVRNFSVDGNRTWYSTSEGSDYTLIINDLKESDRNDYCCGDTPERPGRCWFNRTEVQVTDLQVKVIPIKDDQRVTLVCGTSCRLTQNPRAYIWYKNGEVLYQDWSPWYQHLVSSEEADRYSCAIKGYEDFRAPEVSVDSVTPTCFTVTYAKGRMCSYQQKSQAERCTITYPKGVRLQATHVDEFNIRLTCAPSCPLTAPHTAYRWYWGEQLYELSESQNLTVPRGDRSAFACAVKGHEDLSSEQVCAGDECMKVNYLSSARICSPQGFSGLFFSEYSDPHNDSTTLKAWIKINSDGTQRVVEDKRVTESRDKGENNSMLSLLVIDHLTQEDSAEYKFIMTPHTNTRGVTLVVTGLRVTMSPSAVVTEGQSVTLTCSTSCPLTDIYIWYLNGQPLTSPNQNKHLILHPARRQHAGKYSCILENRNIRSSEVTLTVQAALVSIAVINAVRLAVAALLPILLCLFHLWMRQIYSGTAAQKTQDRV